MLKYRSLFPALVAGALFVGAVREPVFGPHAAFEYARDLSSVFQEISVELAPSVIGVESFAVGDFRGRRSRPVATGSGLVLTEDGTVLTNYHVVKNAEEWFVVLHDGRRERAQLVGTDQDTDLAVLKIDADDLVPARIGGDPEVGEWVLAMGNPYGLQHSVTAGIISAKGRSNLGIALYEDFLQTDAAIHPGNSGGPLVDLEGRVVGINTANADAGNATIGFAIPADIVQHVTRAIVADGFVARGWLGVEMREMTSDAKRAFDGAGVLVRRVYEDSPAERGMLEAGDVILAINGAEVSSSNDLLKAIGLNRPGARAKLLVWRDGEREERTVQLADRANRATR